VVVDPILYRDLEGRSLGEWMKNITADDKKFSIQNLKIRIPGAG
jgi:hypothetical protein